MISSTDRKGQVFVYAYSGLAGLKSKSLSDGANSETRTYDSTGKIHSMQNATSTVTYTYNAKGLPATESDSATGTVKRFEYDSDGNRTAFTLLKNGQTEISQTYEYDKLNRMTAVRENGNVIASYSFDSKGNRTQTVSGGVTTNYTYNIANLLTSQTSGDKLTEQYTHYLNGNIKTKTVNGEVTSYRYDGMNRLSKENDTEYFFDDFGNRIAMISDDAAADYEYDLNNRLVKVVEFGDNYDAKTTTMFYDENGNMVSKAVMTNKRFGENVSGDYTVSKNSDENVALYEYNCYNQLTGVDTRGVMSRYTYSPDGMRASKTVGGNTTAFVYDNANVVAEIAADGMNKYLRGVELIKTDDGVHYIINGQGDVSMLLNFDGTVAASYVFDAYGIQTNGGDVYNPFGYRGEYTDNESGLIYLRARMYDPVTGRFLTEDPAHDGSNWYVYCDGDPVNRQDASGESWFSDLAKDTLQSQKQAEMAKNKALDEAQKNMQRGFWKTGSQKYLRENRGFLTSAWMLEHSLQDNPTDIWRGNDSRIAYLINNDESYLKKLDAAIASSSNGRISGSLDNISFENGDLYYSIHAATIYVDGYKQGNGKWLVKSTMTDRYDFTVIQSLMSQDGTFSNTIRLGTIANDAAVISQALGAINAYNVHVEFYTTR